MNRVYAGELEWRRLHAPPQISTKQSAAATPKQSPRSLLKGLTVSPLGLWASTRLNSLFNSGAKTSLPYSNQPRTALEPALAGSWDFRFAGLGYRQRQVKHE